MKTGSHISDFIYLYPSISAKTKKQSSVVSLSKQSAAFVTTGGRDGSAQVETHQSRPQEAELTRPSPPISGALRDKETQVPTLFSNLSAFWSGAPRTQRCPLGTGRGSSDAQLRLIFWLPWVYSLTWCYSKSDTGHERNPSAIHVSFSRPCPRDLHGPGKSTEQMQNSRQVRRLWDLGGKHSYMPRNAKI